MRSSALGQSNQREGGNWPISAKEEAEKEAEEAEEEEAEEDQFRLAPELPTMMDVLEHSLSDSGSVDIETCNGSLPADSPLPVEEMTSVADSLDGGGSGGSGGSGGLSGSKVTGADSAAAVAASAASASGIRHLYTIEAILGLNSNGKSIHFLPECPVPVFLFD